MNAVRTALVLCLALLAAPAATQERIDFGPFYYLPSEPDRLYLDGPIDPGAMQAFFDHRPQLDSVRYLVLNSTGGVTVEGLALASYALQSSYSTIVPTGGTCTDACFLVFMAGLERRVEGSLAMSSGSEPWSLQHMDATALQDLQRRFLEATGVSEPLGRLFNDLEPFGRHDFTNEELDSYGLRRSLSDGAAQAAFGAAPSFPTELLATPDQEVGQPLVGTLLTADALGNGVRENQVITRWYVSGDGQRAPSIAAVLYTADQSFLAVVTFAALLGETYGEGYVIGVGFASPARTATRVMSFLAGSPSDQRRVFFMQAPGPPVDYPGYANSAFLLLVPGIFGDVTRQSYVEFNRFAVEFAFDDGSTGFLVFAMGNAGRLAFDDVLAAWRQTSG